MSSAFRELRNQVKRELEDTRILYRKYRRQLSPEEKKQLKELRRALTRSLKRKDYQECQKNLSELTAFRKKVFPQVRINRTWETIKEIFWILLIVFLIRWLIIEPFRIPSGSMIPTLLVGDQLMVNKFIYGIQIPLTTKKIIHFKKPQRGEVIIFKYPHNPREDYVKRVVGIEGDEVMIRDGELFINGRKVYRKYLGPYQGPVEPAPFCPAYDLYLERIDSRKHQIILCQRSHTNDDFGPVRVPKGMVFVMGDNRDNSADSRIWGFVPLENIKGRAMFIHLPLNPSHYYLPRWKRFFKWVR